MTRPRSNLLSTMLLSSLAAALAFQAETVGDEVQPRETSQQPAAAIRGPDGFIAEQGAAPPLGEHPMMACFDDRGRLFVAEAAGLHLNAAALLKAPPTRI